MKLLPKLTAVLLACGALLTGVTTPAVAYTATCSETTLPVSGPTGPAVISGQLCTPTGATPTSVQLLVHGGTYSRAYWDMPYGYSYQRDMAEHGYATFAVDRLGTGKSTKPLSLPLLIGVEARSLHEVVSHLRAGNVGRTAFEKVYIVGHSVGSGIVAAEASTYKDVDGVMLTGITHMPNVPALVLGAALGLTPVFMDPVLARLGSDPLWFTTKPGAREPLFYHSPNAEQRVIDADEATKDQVSVPGMGTVAVFGIVLPATLGIDVPVFQAVGQKDVLFCGLLALRDCTSAATLRLQEAPYYTPAAELTMYVLPNSGHSLALHQNAAAYRDAARAWLHNQFGE